MRNLTPEEIERIVEASINSLLTNFTELHQTEIPHMMDVLSTALATVTLDQPRLDLKEVEKLVQRYGVDSVDHLLTTKQKVNHPTYIAVVNGWRKAIGYTRDDLNK